MALNSDSAFTNAWKVQLDHWGFRGFPGSELIRLIKVKLTGWNLSQDPHWSQEPGVKSGYFFEHLLPHMSGKTFPIVVLKIQ